MGPESPSPSERESTDDIKIGDLIQLNKPPYLVKIIPDNDFGDIGAGRISKRMFINAFNAMPEEEKSEIRKINPSLKL